MLAYDSSQTSEFDGTISGAGEIDVDNYIGVLILAGSGSATLAAIQDVSGALEIDNQVSITGAGSYGPQVDQYGYLQGCGTIALASGSRWTARAAARSTARSPGQASWKSV